MGWGLLTGSRPSWTGYLRDETKSIEHFVKLEIVESEMYTKFLRVEKIIKKSAHTTFMDLVIWPGVNKYFKNVM